MLSPRHFLSAVLAAACACAGHGVRAQVPATQLPVVSGGSAPALPDAAAQSATRTVQRFVPPRVLAAMDIKAGTLQSIALPHPSSVATAGAPASLAPVRGTADGAGSTHELRQFSFTVTLGGAEQRIAVQASDVRAPSFQLLERNAAGLVPVRPGPCTTFRGGILGEVASRVAVSFVDGVLRAVIVRQDGLWIVQPLRDAVATAPANLYVVFHGADALPGNGHCGVAPPAAGGGAVAMPGDSVYECELALEADHALYQLNNSNTLATQSEVLGIVNAIDVIYQGGLTVSFQVTQLMVDVAPDPYTTANAAALLAQLQSNWNTNHPAIPRDVMHLFTGRQVGAASGGTVGIANTATACNVTSAYGLSQTRWSPNYALRVGLTAHEIGHNCGANHCDGNGGCSIMCSGIGGCSGVTASFGPTALAEMDAYLQTVGCLTIVPSMPQITSATPVLIETVDPPEVMLGGSGFLGTTSMTVAGQPFTGYQVLSDTQLRFSPPVGLSLGVQSATVTNPAGTSNATFLVYQGSDPCRIVAPINTQGGAPFTWRIGGWPNGTGYLGVSLVDTMTPLQGFPVMTEFLTLWAGPLDARGMANVTVPVVPAVLTGFPFYSQMIDSITGTGNVRSTSLVLRTLIY